MSPQWSNQKWNDNTYRWTGLNIDFWMFSFCFCKTTDEEWGFFGEQQKDFGSKRPSAFNALLHVVITNTFFNHWFVYSSTDVFQCRVKGSGQNISAYFLAFDEVLVAFDVHKCQKNTQKDLVHLLVVSAVTDRKLPLSLRDFYTFAVGFFKKLVKTLKINKLLVWREKIKIEIRGKNLSNLWK